MDYFKRLFQGRVNRSTYFLFTLLLAITAVFLRPVIGIIAAFLPGNSIIWLPELIFVIFLIVLSYSLGVRRLHDMDLSGWFALLYIIFNCLMAIVLAVIPGHYETNKYGKPPKPGIDKKALG